MPGSAGPGPADGGSGMAGSTSEMREPPTASGPTGLTTVLTGAIAISAGAMLSPCDACGIMSSSCPSVERAGTLRAGDKCHRPTDQPVQSHMACTTGLFRETTLLHSRQPSANSN